MRLKELISVITQKEENQRQAGSTESACCETLWSRVTGCNSFKLGIHSVPVTFTEIQG